MHSLKIYKLLHAKVSIQLQNTPTLTLRIKHKTHLRLFALRSLLQLVLDLVDEGDGHSLLKFIRRRVKVQNFDDLLQDDKRKLLVP